MTITANHAPDARYDSVTIAAGHYTEDNSPWIELLTADDVEMIRIHPDNAMDVVNAILHALIALEQARTVRRPPGTDDQLRQLDD